MNGPASLPLATLDEDAWDDLITFIEDKRVIPIIGPDLLEVETETGPRLWRDCDRGRCSNKGKGSICPPARVNRTWMGWLILGGCVAGGSGMGSR